MVEILAFYLVTATFTKESLTHLGLFTYIGLLSPEIHLCGEPTAIDLIKRLVESCEDDFEVKFRHTTLLFTSLSRMMH